MREVRRGIFALSALILVTGCISNPAFAADNQGGTSISPSDDSANNDAVLKTTENHRLAETMAAMENLGILGAHSEYRELIAQTALLDEQTLEVRYWNGGKGSPELARTLASIGDTLPMRVVTVPVSFDPAQLNDLARRISENDPATLTALGLPRVDSVAINTETGELIVYAAQKPDARSVEVDGELLEVDEGVQTIFQHRQDDAPPWSGGVVGRGDALLSTTPDCTFGFNWRKSTGELMGSTAEHCFELGGIGTWYNYGSQIGSRYYYSTDRDTTLIRSSGGLSRFNPNVFVGAANTNEIRWVVQGMPS